MKKKTQYFVTHFHPHPFTLTTHWYHHCCTNPTNSALIFLLLPHPILCSQPFSQHTLRHSLKHSLTYTQNRPPCFFFLVLQFYNHNNQLIFLSNNFSFLLFLLLLILLFLFIFNYNQLQIPIIYIYLHISVCLSILFYCC